MLIFFVKFLKAEQKFSQKLTLGLCQLHQQQKNHHYSQLQF